MPDPSPIRRLRRAAFALAAAGSGVLLLVALGLWGRSYGRVDEVDFSRSADTADTYILASTGGRLVWIVAWKVGEVGGPVQTHVGYYLRVRSDATAHLETNGAWRDKAFRHAVPYGDTAYMPRADQLVARSLGRLGFSWTFEQTFFQHENEITITRKRFSTVPWWAAVCLTAVMPAAWTVARRRAGRRVVPLPTVPAWVRRPARVGLILSSAGCVAALAGWGLTPLTYVEGNTRVWATDLELIAYDGTATVGAMPQAAADDRDGPNFARLYWHRACSDGRGADLSARSSLNYASTGVFRRKGGGEPRPAGASQAFDPPAYARSLALPLLWPAGVFALWPLAAGMRAAARWLAGRRRREGYCACGYDLRASPERCPECGRPASDAAKLPGRRRLPVVAAAGLLLGLAVPNVLRTEVPNVGYYGYGTGLARWSPAGSDQAIMVNLRDGSLWLESMPIYYYSGGPRGASVKRKSWDRTGAGATFSRRWEEEAVALPDAAFEEDWDAGRVAAWRASAARWRVTPIGWGVAVRGWELAALLMVPTMWWGWRAWRSGSDKSFGDVRN